MLDREASEAMISLRQEYLNESVTVLEDKPDAIHLYKNASSSNINNQEIVDARNRIDNSSKDLIDDENAIKMERIQDLLTKALHLQVSFSL